MDEEYKDQLPQTIEDKVSNDGTEERILAFQNEFQDIFPKLADSFHLKDPKSFDYYTKQLLSIMTPENQDIFEFILDSDLLSFIISILAGPFSPFTCNSLQLLESILNDSRIGTYEIIINDKEMPGIVHENLLSDDIDIIGFTLVLINKLFEKSKEFQLECPFNMEMEYVKSIQRFPELTQQLIYTFTTIIKLTINGSQLYDSILVSRMILTQNHDISGIIDEYSHRLKEENEIFDIINFDDFVIDFLLPIAAIKIKEIDENDEEQKVLLTNSYSALNFLYVLTEILYSTKGVIEESAIELRQSMIKCIFCINWDILLTNQWPENHLILIMKLATFVIENHHRFIESFASSQIIDSIPRYIEHGSYDLRFSTLKFVEKLFKTVIRTEAEKVIGDLICPEFAELLSEFIQNDIPEFQKVVIFVVSEFCEKAEILGKLDLLQIFDNQDVYDSLDELIDNGELAFYVNNIIQFVESSRVLWEK
ncbi:hypothetical protein TVAG_349590 [Trichomonas vaginalis G3]|uniref:Uncharacterized protein n=1 Tax=Trichomonas vaginalis (strain ATCC PRA-98 / G3) TaxID=412133 RepID=A2EMN6_TRIV3|nr:armadillo (ARM) repeat-containing protein family [Trichomonas vaginalis G3]EAY06106.1 hypothetical protein TVAG_349590 [Trichomonas vaginalis G3]KAI5497158.1 armadillo (ARM) repeat-containing protein family [Trichomonas vaginalis G3]|eukprot:XP_001318329.1 hypothetical protein [Trichomonas vaginalis G3]